MKKINIENYFIDGEQPRKEDKRLVLVIYDIIDNKRRYKFVKLMESYGVRVQKSAFEMILSRSQYNELVKRIPTYISPEDNIRVYKLKVNGEILSWGSGMTAAEDVIII